LTTLFVIFLMTEHNVSTYRTQGWTCLAPLPTTDAAYWRHYCEIREQGCHTAPPAQPAPDAITYKNNYTRPITVVDNNTMDKRLLICLRLMLWNFQWNFTLKF